MEITIIITVVIGLIFCAAMIEFAMRRPYTIVFMMLLAIFISPDGGYVFTALTLIMLSWLFTTREGLTCVAAFLLSFYVSSRQK
jgi:Ca2+/Na+ antiporter